MPFVADTPPPASTGRFVPDQLPPLMDPREDAAAQMAQKDAVKLRTDAAAERQRVLQSNLRPGVPLDVTESLPASTRARLSFETDPDKQVDLLSKRPGVLAARKSADGKNVLATVAGEGGKQKDVLLNPLNSRLTGSDVAGATFPLMKAIPTTVAAIATDGLGPLLTSLIMGGTAAGSHTIGEGGSRLLAGQDLDPKNLALSAGKEGALNAALPLAGAAVKGAANKFAGLFNKNAGQIEQAATQAATRQQLPLAASLSTGSPALAKAEQVAGSLGAGEQDALLAAKNRALGQNDTLAGPQKIATEAEIAGTVKPLAAAAEQSASKAVDTGFSDAQKAAQARIQTQLDSGLVPTNLTQTDAGNFIRGKVEAARNTFQAASQKNYGDLYELADKEGLAIPTDALTKLSKEIQAKDPHGAIEQIVPEVRRVFGLEAKLNPAPEAGTPTGLLDQFGKPLVSAPVQPPPVTLPQAIELRAVINDKIARGEAVGDIPGRYLKDLAKSLTEAIDQGVKSGSPDLQKAYDTAKTAYAADIGKFKSADVGKLFIDPEKGSALGDDEIIPALFRGRGNLDALGKLKDVLGPTSNDYRLLLRQGVQSIADEAKKGGDLIDAGAFLSRLGNLSPDMVAELGPTVAAVRKSATLLARAQGKDIPAAELADALAASPGQAANLLTQAIQREEAYNLAYQNSISRQLRDGVLGPQTMGKADDFVTRFIANADTAQVKQALTQIGASSPETVTAIRQRTLQNILEEAAKRDPQKGAIQDLKPDVLRRYLDDKYKAVLGKEGHTFLEDMAAYADAQTKRAINSGVDVPSAHGTAKEIAGAAGKSTRDIAGTAYNLAASVPRYVLGKATGSDAVRRYLTTGELPQLSTISRATALAAPELTAAEERTRNGKRLPFASGQEK